MSENKKVLPIPPKALKSMEHWREWNIEGISVNVTSLRTAIITAEKYIVNAHLYRYEKFVHLNIIDRIKGITLEEKVQKTYDKVVSKLEQENIKIREMKRIEASAKKGESNI